MFIQLQAYWDVPVNFAPKVIIGAEVFHCHDLADLYAAQRFLANKANPLVYMLERDGNDMCHTAVDLDELIREQEAEQHHDHRLYLRGVERAAE